MFDAIGLVVVGESAMALDENIEADDGRAAIPVHRRETTDALGDFGSVRPRVSGAGDVRGFPVADRLGVYTDGAVENTAPRWETVAKRIGERLVMLGCVDDKDTASLEQLDGGAVRHGVQTQIAAGVMVRMSGHQGAYVVMRVSESVCDVGVAFHCLSSADGRVDDGDDEAEAKEEVQGQGWFLSGLGVNGYEGEGAQEFSTLIAHARIRAKGIAVDAGESGESGGRWRVRGDGVVFAQESVELAPACVIEVDRSMRG